VNGKLDRGGLPDPGVREGERYVAPGNEVEAQLCALYGEVLGLDGSKVGVEDDFFQLGGDSIVSIQLASRIRQRLGIQVEVKDIFMCRTIRELYRRLIIDGPGEDFEPYIPINVQPYENDKVIFMLPPGDGGGESYFRNVIAHLPGARIVAFNNYYKHIKGKLTEEEYGKIDFEFLATYYIELMKQVQPTGPYYLFGWSFGGILAFEIARQLKEMEVDVEKLILIDPLFNMADVYNRFRATGQGEIAEIQHRYRPTIRDKDIAKNIVLFKPTKIKQHPGDSDLILNILKHYALTRDNHLGDLIGSDNFTVIHMDVDHYSCLNDKDVLNKIRSYLSTDPY